MKGLSTEEIALERKLSLMTIQAHFIKLFQEGYEIDLSEFVDPKEVALIAVAKKKLNNPTGLKPYFEYFEEQMSYETIKFSLAILEKK